MDKYLICAKSDHLEIWFNVELKEDQLARVGESYHIKEVKENDPEVTDPATDPEVTDPATDPVTDPVE